MYFLFILVFSLARLQADLTSHMSARSFTEDVKRKMLKIKKQEEEKCGRGALILMKCPQTDENKKEKVVLWD